MLLSWVGELISVCQPGLNKLDVTAQLCHNLSEQRCWTTARLRCNGAHERQKLCFECVCHVANEVWWNMLTKRHMQVLGPALISFTVIPAHHSVYGS